MIKSLVKLARQINFTKRAQAYGGFPQNLVGMNPQKLQFSPYSGAFRPQQSSNRPFGLNFSNAASMLAQLGGREDNSGLAGSVPGSSGGVGDFSGLGRRAPMPSTSFARSTHTPSDFSF